MEKLRPAWAVKAIVVILITSILFRCVCGANHTVGGPSGWDLRSNLQAWSSSTTFNVGDDLVFTYTPVHDVVEVNQLGYETCTISNAIATYSSGDTVIHLTSAGTRYFVCGRLGHCQQGLKLQVQVVAQSNNNNGTNDDGAPPPPPQHTDLLLPPRFAPDTPDTTDAPPADVPLSCDCSRAGYVMEHGLLPSITLAITIVVLSSARPASLLPLKHHLLVLI